jgi:RNA polymerase sigma factor (sigma-70 family)
MKKYKTEKELVSACLQRKAPAQRELYDQFVRAMYNTVYRYTCNHHDTQDILQNGFTRIFKNLNQFDPQKGSLLTWIRTIHIRCALDFLKSKNLSFEEINDLTTLSAFHSVDFDKLEAEYILEFIKELNPRDRIIFNMHHIEGYSHEEIAEQLSININSSRVYLARARKLLREKITAYHGRLSLVQ